MSVDATSPETLFGGTWEALNEGRVLIGAGAAYPAGSTGGESAHILTTNEMPSHAHSVTVNYSGDHNHNFYSGLYGSSYAYFPNDEQGGAAGARNTYYTSTSGSHTHSASANNSGGGQAHNNMQPYLAVYMWKRIA